MKTPVARHKCNSDGTVVTGRFDAQEALPDGWFHSPKEAREAFQESAQSHSSQSSQSLQRKRGPGRPPKAKSA